MLFTCDELEIVLRGQEVNPQPNKTKTYQLCVCVCVCVCAYVCAYVRASVCGVSNDLENKNNHRALVAILNKHNVCIHSAILDSLSTQFFYCAHIA